MISTLQLMPRGMPRMVNRRRCSVQGPRISAGAPTADALLMLDEHLGRADALLLVATWVVGTAVVQRRGQLDSAHQESLLTRSVLASLRTLFSGLLIVAAGALIAVWAFTEIAAWIGIPEYASSFLALSLGTSLPELVIDGNALRKGETSLALGGLVGSSFADATLSLGSARCCFPSPSARQQLAVR
jgi:cation:H+ antiporter